MDDQQRRDEGMAQRRKVLGDAWVDKSAANMNSFNAEFIDLITRHAWADIWTRPHYDQRTRRMLVIGLAGLSVTSALFLLVGLDTSLWWIRGIMFLRGVSMSFALVAAPSIRTTAFPFASWPVTTRLVCCAMPSEAEEFQAASDRKRNFRSACDIAPAFRAETPQ